MKFFILKNLSFEKKKILTLFLSFNILLDYYVQI